MNEQTSEPKDGFDLIEYPCEFSFKAMCRASSGNSQEIVKQLVLRHVSEQDIKGVKEISSRTGKFNSVTITVVLAGRDTLEAVYREFSDSDQIVMTL